ncbi:MAG: tetratricopeptide repeat protein [Lysobacterales bacterium]
MRCGKSIQAPETAASRHARAFAQRELEGPFFGAFPEALDFSVSSLARMDALVSEMWGESGEAPGRQDWQPSAAKMPIVIDLGAYLGEVLCRALPAVWEMNPAHPEVVIAARVVDAQGRRINTFAQIGVRFRDGASVGMASLYTALTGRTLPPWRVPRQGARAEIAPARPSPPVAPAAPVDVPMLLQQAREHAERGHYSNAARCLRQVLAQQPNQHEVRRDLAMALAQSGAIDECLNEIEIWRRLQPQDVSAPDLRASVLAQAGRFDEALGTLDLALMRQPGEIRLLRRRAFVLLRMGRWEQAQTALGRLEQLGAVDAEIAMGLAQALAEQGQVAAARARLSQLLSNPIPGRTAELDLAARSRLKQWEAASAPNPTAPADATDEAARHYAQAIEHARNRRFDQALPLFEAAARLQPMRLHYLKDVGQCLNDLGRVADARECFVRCLALDPGYSAARWGLGVIEEKLGRREQAIQCYRDLLARLDSDQGDVSRAFARLQALGAVPT